MPATCHTLHKVKSSNQFQQWYLNTLKLVKLLCMYTSVVRDNNYFEKPVHHFPASVAEVEHWGEGVRE